MHAVAGIFIAFCWAVLFVWIRVAAFATKRDLETDRRWDWSWLALALVLAALTAGRFLLRLPTWVGFRILPHTPALTLAAAFLVLAGFGVALWGRLALGRNWNLMPSLKQDHELIIRGPYAWVRHPMYSGLLLMLLGTVAWHGGGAVCMLWPLSFLGTWLKLRQEEKLLTRHFGAAYRAYQARVGALVPFLMTGNR
jgi:protein-S-isoprenylcysteine O-methyltransferase Ste14